ncbi:MAG: DUF2848 family protein [Candidatus Sumerlaeota bacterium]|nr:DUF2848 family protein [Candidatus Sumerlaeota bacterium]
MKELHLQVATDKGLRPLRFAVRHMVNAGYVGRNRAAVQAHIDELAREGVPPPPSIPMLVPMLTRNVTTDEEIEALGEKTSGEAEYVLLIDGDEIFVGVGSDHTDREMESYSIVQSKHVCPNVLSSEVWRYEDVRAQWDSLQLRSFVKQNRDGEESLYQDAALGTIIEPGELMTLVSKRYFDGALPSGLVIYSGTVPVVTKEIIYGECFRAELHRPDNGKTLKSAYSVKKMLYRA